MMKPMNEAAGRTDSGNAPAVGGTKTIIDLPAGGVLTDSALIDQVIAQIYDQLGQTQVELRIQPRAAGRE